MAISPDGASVASCASGGSTVWLWATAMGEQRQVGGGKGRRYAASSMGELSGGGGVAQGDMGPIARRAGRRRGSSRAIASDIIYG